MNSHLGFGVHSDRARYSVVDNHSDFLSLVFPDIGTGNHSHYQLPNIILIPTTSKAKAFYLKF